jgi:mannose-6-phosphate isomerase
MEEEKKLYPVKFCTLQDDYPWGSEEFKLADLGYRDSLIREGWLAGNSLAELMDTYLDRVVGDNVYEYYGRQFPVCVRVLHVKGRMPLRVHPDDETAAQRYDFLGKEKLWYVLRAGADARLMVGFRRDTDAAEVYAKCLDGSIEGVLNVIAPHAGQCLHIPAGTPHAAAGDVEILEIGESSPMDFCLCGWGEEVHPDEFDPALTLVDALDWIDYRRFGDSPVKPANDGKDLAPGATRLVDLPQLRVDRIPLSTPLQVRREVGPFLLYSCVKGAASVQLPLAGGQQLDFPVKAGETLLVPAECAEFVLGPTERDTILLETTVVRNDADPYINPSAAPTLPEDAE